MMRSLAVYFAFPCLYPSRGTGGGSGGGQAVEPGPAWSPLRPAVDKATVPMAGEGLEAAFRTLLWSVVCRHGGGGAALVFPPHWALGVHSTGHLRACFMPPESCPFRGRQPAHPQSDSRPPAWWLVQGPVPFQNPS